MEAVRVEEGGGREGEETEELLRTSFLRPLVVVDRLASHELGYKKGACLSLTKCESVTFLVKRLCKIMYQAR